jgi:hypothetical protein
MQKALSSFMPVCRNQSLLSPISVHVLKQSMDLFVQMMSMPLTESELSNYQYFHSCIHMSVLLLVFQTIHGYDGHGDEFGH